jgi:predicted regulator of Ras-like GTPase activity (Roadblock/LC7/MglB family)
MSYSLDFRGAVRTIAATLVVSMGSLVVQPSAFAQSDDDRAGARVAATEGVKAINEKRWADAADLFTRAESLVHSPVHLLYLARAQVQLGKLVKARENYNRIIREHYAADAPDAFRQAQTSAQQEVTPIEGRLAAITVKLDGEKGNVTVTDNGEKVPAALIGLPLPVDPGTHTFAAQGTDLKSDPLTVTVAEGGKTAITLTVKAAPGTVDPFAAAPANTAAAPGAPTPAGPTAAGAANQPPTSAPSGRPVPTGVYIGIAATGALAVAAGVTGVLTLSKKSDFDNKNDGSNPDQATSLRSSGQTLGLMSDIFTAGAVVAAGVTAYLYFARPENPAAQQGNHFLLSPAVARDGAALHLSGRF